MDSLTFLQGAAKAKPRPIYVLYGDEHFLKRRVMAALRTLVLGVDDDGFGLSSRDGEKANWAEIRDELETLPFLSSRRLVILERAESFVTRERPRLEKYFAEPSKTGVLVLEVQSWPANTKLAKALPDPATIVCKAPEARKLPEWCVEWCDNQHDKPLSAPAARLLVDLVGADMGLLDQEMAKLAIYAGSNSRIDMADVDQLVGQSRLENTWKIFDLIGNGQTGDALTLLDRLLDQGDEPLRLLGAFSMQLRRLAQAARLHSQGESMSDALEHAGVPPFGRRSAEQQVRHLGRRRLDLVYDWLLETDLGLKGSSQLPPRTLLERLVVQLARKR
ncbi:MAG TPA: DNA polymerase III subunit delta [Gemmataceae bacterium]|jgi:DNA polymerase-3 subunit delta